MENNPLKMPCIILSAISLVSLAASAVFIMSNQKLEQDNSRREDMLAMADSEKDEWKRRAEEAEEALAAASTAVAETEAPVETEPVYSVPVTDENTVYIYDNGIDLIEYPPIDGAKFNDYDMSLLQTADKKRKTLYGADGQKRTRFGIDISAYQTNIDWQAVKDDGVEFAFIRAGYRGYESGKIVEDKYFRRNIEGASAAGIDMGIYFFSQALNEAEAVEEAEYLLKLVDETGVQLTLPIVFDWEFPTDEDPARTDGMTGETQTVCCKAFCKVISDAGYQPMYYATVATSIFRYDMGELKDIPLWIAEYSETTRFVYDYKMWQYSCSGVVDGIEGLVDLNIWIDE